MHLDTIRKAHLDVTSWRCYTMLCCSCTSTTLTPTPKSTLS